jgi:hypothetical protein
MPRPSSRGKARSIGPMRSSTFQDRCFASAPYNCAMHPRADLVAYRSAIAATNTSEVRNWDKAPLCDVTSVVAGWYWPNVTTGVTWAGSKLRQVACDKGYVLHLGGGEQA